MAGERNSDQRKDLSGPANRWREVWENRQEQRGFSPDLTGLLRANGFDTTLAGISTDAWRSYVHSWAARLEIGPGSSVFEVGCGAGAFLYVLGELGCSVGGCDFSSSQIARARAAFPDSPLYVCEAGNIADIGTWDIVIANGVFMYFPSLEYAAEVCRSMCESSAKAVAILDLPDLELKIPALEMRLAAAGGPSAYAARYDGLDHQYFEREWIARQLRDLGLNAVATASQDIEGYGNAAFRFNAWGFRGKAGDRK